MKILFTIIFLVAASCFCRGQSQDKRPAYSMKKDAPVIVEEKSDPKMISAEELKSRTSASMYKNHTSSDTGEPVDPNAGNKEGENQSILKTKPKGTKHVEKEDR